MKRSPETSWHDTGRLSLNSGQSVVVYVENEALVRFEHISYIIRRGFVENATGRGSGTKIVERDRRDKN